jgi:lipopolysaccharide export system permease protein
MIAFGMLGRYFGRRFLTAVAVAFLTCVALIAVVDFFELTRRVGDRPDSSVMQIGYLVLLRLPSFTEQMLPFATLIGAMSAFLALSRRLEFVIARASACRPGNSSAAQWRWPSCSASLPPPSTTRCPRR